MEKKKNTKKEEQTTVKEKDAVKNKKSLKKDVQKKETQKEIKKDKGIFKSILKYFKGVGKEVKRIRWTTGGDLVKYSIATVIFVLFFGVYFYIIDWVALLIRSMAN